MMHRRERARRGMSAPNSLVGGAGAIAASRYVEAAVNWAGTILIIRTLSANEWGRLALVFSILGMIGLVSDLKIGRIVLQSVLEDVPDADRSAGSYLVFRGLIGVISYGVAMAIVTAGAYPDEVVHATAIAGLVLFIASLSSALSLTFHARMQMNTVAVATVVAQVIQLVAIFGLLSAGRTTVVWFAVPAVGGAVVNLVLRIAYGHRYYRWTASPGLWWAWLKEAAPLSIGGLLVAAYMNIDTLMLSQLDTFTAVGLYGVGHKFANLIQSLPGAVMAPAFTLLVQAWPNDMDRFRQVFRQTFALLLFLGIGMLVGFTVFAEPVTILFFGDRYVASVDASRLLVLSKVLSLFTVLCFTMLTAVGRHRLYPVAGLVGVVVNVSLNVVLIPAHSFRGAAAATVVTEVVVLTVLAAGAVRVPGVRPVPLMLVVRTLAAAGLTTASLLILREVLPWFVAAALGGVVYAGASHLFRAAGPGGLRDLVRPETSDSACRERAASVEAHRTDAGPRP